MPLSIKSFQQNADRLRKLTARFPKTPPDVIWLETICQAIAIGFVLGPHAKEAAKQLAFSYAAGVGEARWAWERLLPWIEDMRTPADFKADRETLARFFEEFLSQGV